MKKIIVVFKTHLDIGFTDLAEKVTANYLCSYLQGAMGVARQMRGEQEGFIWTTGSWLIEKFLEESPDRDVLEEAVQNGEVRWHGLPFTTHTELMDEELFRYGLGISQGLDARFGMHTIAAKMTDVPGHTRAMIPYLVQSGIRFLHIGVNPASRRPQVPTLFWWKAVTGEKLLVMYNNDYGELTPIGEGGTAVYFAHTGDNRGPQSPEVVREIYKGLHKRYPEAALCGGTLEDVAQEALIQEDLPEIEEEIGDTWIHGAGTDPRKMNQFRGLLRLKKYDFSREKLADGDLRAMYRELLMVPEHTWGLDEKVWLGSIAESGSAVGEHTVFTKGEFLRARQTEKFKRMETSWQEQRDYVERAAAAVSPGARGVVQEVMSAYRRQPWELEGFKTLYEICSAEEGRPHPRSVNFFINGYQGTVDSHGAICGLASNGVLLADGAHPLGAFSYEVFSRQEYARFLDQYVVSREDWALEDFDKIGMERAVSRRKEYLPVVQGIYASGSIMVIIMRLPEEASDLYGGMKRLEMVVWFTSGSIVFDFAWWDKEPTRVAEASWLSFCPMEKVTQIHKLGAWIRPDQVVKYGNRRMHAVDQGIQFESMMLQTFDAPLVSLGERSLLDFKDTLPDLDKGVFVNLHNNVWGTNFPMWYDEDARFRFLLKLDQ